MKRMSNEAAPRMTAAAAFFFAIWLCDGPAARGEDAAAEFAPYTETLTFSDGQSVTFEMVPVGGGEFTLGSPEGEAGRMADEGPRVKLTVEPFWMSRTEVTWAVYDRFMAEYDAYLNHPQHRLPAIDADAVSFPTHLYEPGHTFEKGHEGNQPAVTMTHFAARQFTKWLSLRTGRVYRLPSEAEWEYAARAGSAAAYCFGDDAALLPQYGWFTDNAEDGYHPVGSLKPSALGLYDMHGNVAEWVLDAYAADHYAKLAAAGVTTGAGAVNRPSDQYPHVTRGGSWFDFAEDARSAARRASAPEWSDQDPQSPNSIWWHTDARFVGIRLLRPVAAPTAEQRRLYWEPLAEMDSAVLDLQDKQVRVRLENARPLPPPPSP